MSGHRHAATALHGLAKQDQAMILAALAPEDQQQLRSHLRELKELGFSPSAMQVDLGAMQALKPVARAEAGAHDLVQGASVAAMLEVLAHEPATLIGRLLRIAPWPWADALLEQLPAPRRLLVRNVLDVPGAAAPALDRLLLESVAAALADAAPVQAAPAGVGTLLMNKVKAWTR